MARPLTFFFELDDNLNATSLKRTLYNLENYFDNTRFQNDKSKGWIRNKRKPIQISLHILKTLGS